MKALKEGWKPLVDIYTQYKIDSGYANRMIKKFNHEYKEQIGRTWVVKEDLFLQFLGKKDNSKDINNKLIDFIKELILKVEKNNLINLVDISLKEDSKKLVNELIIICMDNNIDIPTDLFNALKDGIIKKYEFIVNLIDKAFKDE
ncbi:hypothetical protein [Clostridium sp. Marseille-Q2269]|uniref:hypothetical protein n=1 Tax=Clostridium sp. Marseille-Q2269 TaxID=2942205 RepID=UPI0020733876|nr:hypothetical protein [Clostridium sp. Marseille-Q2269]